MVGYNSFPMPERSLENIASGGWNPHMNAFRRHLKNKETIHA